KVTNSLPSLLTQTTSMDNANRALLNQLVYNLNPYYQRVMQNSNLDQRVPQITPDIAMINTFFAKYNKTITDLYDVHDELGFATGDITTSLTNVAAALPALLAEQITPNQIPSLATFNVGTLISNIDAVVALQQQILGFTANLDRSVPAINT